MLGIVKPYTQSQHDDPLNIFQKRTLYNTPTHTYNCAGYALKCFSWYYPESYDAMGLSDEVRTAEQVKCMLKDFPNLRVIRSLAELEADEQAVAFRIAGGRSNDFHYILRARNGHWFHKRGNSSYIETMPAAQVFNRHWDYRYYGPIVLFARKNP